MAPELDAIFIKLIKKEKNYKSDNLGLNLLISRLQGKYSKNPKDEELDNCLKEIKAFFSKYDRIMQNDIKKLMTLQEE